MRRHLTIGLALVGATLATPGLGATLRVANNGTDSLACGASSAPCRSISQAIQNATAGDKIVVGAGNYGDIDNDGSFTSPGDEFGTISGCCAVVVDKALTITSADGATATVINVRNTGAEAVNIDASSAVFGKKGKGFTVVADGTPPFSGISVNSGTTAVSVQGNTLHGFGRGVDVAGDAGFITNNIATVNLDGLNIGGNGNIVQANVASDNAATGIVVAGSAQTIAKNVCHGNQFTGVRVVSGSGHTITGNSANGNGSEGIKLDNPSSASVTVNNLFATTSNCGLVNDNNVGIIATTNFWGASTGPGADPADNVCNLGVATTDTSGFLTKPLTVRAKPQR